MYLLPDTKSLWPMVIPESSGGGSSSGGRPRYTHAVEHPPSPCAKSTKSKKSSSFLAASPSPGPLGRVYPEIQKSIQNQHHQKCQVTVRTKFGCREFRRNDILSVVGSPAAGRQFNTGQQLQPSESDRHGAAADSLSRDTLSLDQGRAPGLHRRIAVGHPGICTSRSDSAF